MPDVVIGLTVRLRVRILSQPFEPVAVSRKTPVAVLPRKVSPWQITWVILEVATGLIVIVILVEVAVTGLAHNALLVNTHVTTSLLCKAELE